MKYIIPQDKIENLVFKYLDKMYGDLEKFKPKYYEGIIFKKPNVDSEYGIMGWDKNDEILCIHYKITQEISSMFSLKYIDSEEIIGKWVEDRHKLKVVRIDPRKDLFWVRS